MNVGYVWRIHNRYYNKYKCNSIVRAATFVLTTTSVFQSTTHCFPIHNKYQNSSQRMSSKLVDVDCNLQHDDLIQLSQQSTTSIKNDDVPDCFQLLYHPSIQHANIGAMIVPSSTILESQSMQSLLSQLTSNTINGMEVKTTVGVHPYHAQEEDTLQQVSVLKELLSQPSNICAIGECGLDYSPGFPDKSYQYPWFQQQVQLAIQYQLPLFIHERLAFHDLLQVLDSNNNNNNGLPPIIIHCFTGTVEECREYIARGYSISISGFILKKGSEEVQQCLRDGIIPLHKLMVETDAPYMGFPSCRDTYNQYEDLSQLNSKQRKRIQKSIYPNVPTSLPQVLHAILDLLNQGRMQNKEQQPLLTYEQLATITSQNAKQFFNLDLTIDTTTTNKEE